jgi:glutaredoxin
MPTVKELQAQARQNNISGYSSLRKDELIALLTKSLSTNQRKYKRKSPKRKSPKRKSPKRKSPKRKSPKRKSPKRKSPKRKSPENKLLDEINKIKWYIFTMKGCKYCSEAINLLSQHNQHFTTQEVNKYNIKDIYSIIDSSTSNYRYFPIIFHNDEFIGGYQELKTIFEQ